MYQYFAQLRRLPEPARRKKAFFISVAVTLAIALIWASFLYMKIQNGTFMAKAEEKPAPEADAPGIVEIFAGFFTGIGDIFDSSETYENTANTFDSR